MRNLALVLILSGLCAQSNIAAATEPQAAFNPQCNIEDQDTVIWHYSGEAVTLTTQIFMTERDYYPHGKLSLTLADGTVLDLGQGMKYVDDYADTPPTCREIADIAKGVTLASLTGQDFEADPNSLYAGSISKPESHLETLSSAWAYSVMGQDCMDAVNLAQDGPSLDCQRAADFREGFTAPDAGRTISYDRFEALTKVSAPLIHIRRSTYYDETFVFDPETKSLEYVFAQGC